MTQTAAKNIRIGGGRSTTGCLTCRVRRVKCDETWPQCQKCARSDRACRYPESSPAATTGRSSPIRFINYVPLTGYSQPSGRSSPLSSFESRALEFFQLRTVSALNYPFTSQIWSRHILLVSHYEPAIRHAVIALSSLHELFLANENLEDDSAEVESATKHYAKAIKLVVDSDFVQNDQAADVALSTCILFTCYETLRGHYQSALSHVRSGVNVFAEVVSKQTTFNLWFAPPSLYQEVFCRLGTQLIEIGDANFQSPSLGLSSFDQAIPQAFQSVESAAFTFDALTHSLLYLLHHAESLSARPETPAEGQLQEIGAKQADLMNSYRQWCASFQNMLDRHDRTFLSAEEENKWNSGTLILIIWRTLMNILLQINPTSGEMIWDQLDAEWRQVISDCSKVVELDRRKNHPNDPQTFTPTFTMSLGIIQGLWLVCVRSRNPIIRRGALDVLRDCRRREGVWDSTITALAAERIIDMEEEAARRYHSATDESGGHLIDASDIPEHVRIGQIDPSFGPGRQARVRYTRVGGGNSLYTPGGFRSPGASHGMTYER
ncbi:hypothetical protein EDD37DRAFT_636834 [Exophiala viscosa]|uniref:uncharacterized protein n=1 Tax=Exophiala viscosa TaxID=2486360 RepID=UPI00218E1FBA|nr:hypothetical protein EDD37DRAFT_636834 [Exophiala viscosa]